MYQVPGTKIRKKCTFVYYSFFFVLVPGIGINVGAPLKKKRKEKGAKKGLGKFLNKFLVYEYQVPVYTVGYKRALVNQKLIKNCIEPS